MDGTTPTQQVNIDVSRAEAALERLHTVFANLDRVAGKFVGTLDDPRLERSLERITQLAGRVSLLTQSLKGLRLAGHALRLGSVEAFLGEAALAGRQRQRRFTGPGYDATARQQVEADARRLLRDAHAQARRAELGDLVTRTRSLRRITSLEQALLHLEASRFRIADALARLDRDGASAPLQRRLDVELRRAAALERITAELKAQARQDKEQALSARRVQQQAREANRVALVPEALKQRFFASFAGRDQLLGQRIELETDPLRRARLELRRLEGQREEALRRAGGAATDEVRRYTAALEEARRKLDQLREASGDLAHRTRTLRRDRQLRADPELLRSRADLSSQVGLERVLGSGAADTFKIQAALLGNYLILNKVSQAFGFLTGFVLDLNRALHDLQAIAGISNREMASLSATILGVSAGTRFTAVEVAEAAKILAQAGFSAAQIRDSLRGVTLLATATGSSLQEAVDVATTVIGVFNQRAEEMGDISNIITAALNLSKLTMEKFALALQYTANIAADSHVPFVELTAVLAQIANAGIRSGSTLGTGLRQLIIDLSAPSDQLKRRLGELGLSVEDVNLRTHGLVGVLKTLKAAGFTTADAMATLEVRAANAFSAATRNLHTVERFQQALILSNAAAEANAVQMTSLTHTLAQFKSVAGTLASHLAGDLVAGLQKLVAHLSGVLGTVNELGPALSVIGNLLAAVLASALVGVVSRTQAVQLALGHLTAGFAAATAGGVTLTAVLRGLFLAMGGWPGLIVLGSLGLLTDGFGLLTGAADRAGREFDELKAAGERLQGAVDATEQTLASLDQEIETLADRSVRLGRHTDELATAALQARQRFGDLGLQLDTTKLTVEGLIGALQTLKGELSSGLEVDYRALSLNEVEKGRRKFAELRRSLGPMAALTTGPGALSSFPLVRQAHMPDSVREAKDFVRTAQPEPTQEGLNAFIEAANRVLGAVNRDRAAALQGTDARLQELLQKTFEDVKAVREKAEQVLATTLQAQVFAEQADVKGFLAGRGAPVRARMTGLRQRVAAERERLTQVQDVEERKQLAQDIRARLLAEFADLDAGTGALPAADRDRLARSGLLDEIQGMRRQVDTLVDGVLDEALKETGRTLEQKIGLLETQARHALARLDDHSRPSEIHAAGARAKDLLRQAGALKLRLAREVQAKDYPEPLRADFLGTAQAEIDEQLREVDDQIAGRLDRAAAAADGMAEVLTNYRERIKHLNRRLDLALDAAKAPREAVEAQLQAARSQVNRRVVPEAQVRHLERQKEQAAAEEAAAREAAYRQDAAAAAGLLVEIEDEILERERRRAALRRQLAGDLSAVERGRTDGDLGRTERELNALLDRRTELLDKLARTQQDLTQAAAEYDALTRRATPVSPGQALDLAVAEWREQNQVLDDVGKQMADHLPRAFDHTSDALADLVGHVAAGTATITGAFRGMAAGVVKALLDIAARRTALSVLDTVFGALGLGGGRLLGRGAPSDVRPEDIIVGQRLAAGGLIRAAAGRFITTRDAVPVLARPGEYILRTSAVEALGRDNLDRLNALGNRVVSRAAPPPVPPAPRGEGGVVNVWVVSPEQVPPPGPKDIIAAAADDLVRGGTLKKLVKQIQMGTL